MSLFNCPDCYPRLCRCMQPRPPTVGERKALQLTERGLEPIGVLLHDPASGQRATVDTHGRVQWWSVDGAGRMYPAENITQEAV